ncbi:MAG: hypothetical protein NT062_10900 [Proteobacteria bacterium]|nr:hypothetical protein [Pseudomonadota bacterium]
MRDLLRVALSVLLVPALASVASAAPTERRVYSNDADASSYHPSAWTPFAELGHPNYVLDDDATTAWVEASPGSGAGEWLRVDIAPLDRTTKVKLKVRNGCQQTKEAFAQNARAKDVTIRLLPGNVDKKVTLADKPDWQEVEIEQPSGPLRGVELRLGAVTEGGKTKDLCIADVQVFATSETTNVAAFEVGKQKALAEWRANRAAFAKIAAKTSIPLHAAYDIVTKDWKPAAAGTGFAAMIAATEGDKVLGPELKYATNRAKKFLEALATVQRVTFTLKAGPKLPAVDGVQIPTFNDIAEGDFDDDAFRMPMLAGSGILFRDQVTVADRKDKLTPDDWAKQTGACTGGDVAWVARGETSEMTAGQIVQVMMIGRCAMVTGRGGPRAHRERELYLFGPEGQVVLVIAATHVEGYRWGLVRGKPMITGARSILATSGKLIDARVHEEDGRRVD